MQGTEHRAKELKRAAKQLGNQQQDKNPHGEQQVGNSRCHFEKELQKSLIVPGHRQVKRHESASDANPGAPRDSNTIGSSRQAVLMHDSTTRTCLSTSLNRHVVKLSSKLVTRTPVLGTIFGTSAEDITFYGRHHTEGNSTGTAQPSMLVN